MPTQPTPSLTLLDRGRRAFARGQWRTAFDSLSEADRLSRLGLDDLERLATAAFMLGRDDVGLAVGERVHGEARRSGDVSRAVRAAFWIGMSLLDRGELARAGGWFSRAERELGQSGLDSVERGYLLVPNGLRSMAKSDPKAALVTFGQVAVIGERFADPDLTALGRVGRGEALVSLGDTRPAMAEFDEAMVAVLANELSPAIVGIVYCSVIEACQATFDMHRAQEWTMAMSDWCAQQPDMVRFRGQCLLRRAQLMQLRGRWGDAEEETRIARERLALPDPDRALGEAVYQQAELLRLRGAFVEADDAYRHASELGRSPEPGLALLRLANDQVEVAAAMIRRALSETEGQPARARLLEPFVEISLAAGDLGAARDAANELREIAAALEAPLLDAVANRAGAAVLVAQGEPAAALVALRRSAATWTELNAPFEAARVRVLIARACEALGDAETAALELDAARRTFRELGARPELTRVEAMGGPSSGRLPGGLTPREVEVLRLVATGKTNRMIAADLVLSEKTVARHLSNIFSKLGVSSRSAATAYAYEHDLVGAQQTRGSDT